MYKILRYILGAASLLFFCGVEYKIADYFYGLAKGNTPVLILLTIILIPVGWLQIWAFIYYVDKGKSDLEKRKEDSNAH